MLQPKRPERRLVLIAAAAFVVCAAGIIGLLVATRQPPTMSSAPAAPLTVGKDTELHSVACNTINFCLAVGSYSSDGSSNDRHALVEAWNGTRWQVVAAPSPGADVVLNGVACTSSSLCLMVGSATAGIGAPRQAFALRWTGGRLSTMAMPATATDTVLNGVTCPLKQRCLAVGSSKHGSLPFALLETWDGGRWSASPAATPAGGVDSWLNSIGCANPTSCVAVGAYSTSGDHDDPESRTLIETWDGSVWTVATSGGPSAGNLAVLSSVACASRTACFAVGNDSPVNQAYGDDTVALIEGDRGSAWAAVDAHPGQGATQSTLQSIGCAANRCLAVGSAPTSQYGIANGYVEMWNGTRWSPDKLNLPGTVLESVTCPSASTCLVVGEHAAGTSAFARWLPS